MWRRLHELADEIQKGDKHGTIGNLASAGASVSSQNSGGDVGNNPLNSTATQNNNSQAAAVQSHTASTISTQMNSLSISAAAGSMSK